MTEPTWTDPDFARWYIGHLAAGSLPNDAALACLWEICPSVQGERVLDLACGDGVLARSLASRGAEVVGLDISPVLIDEARRREYAHAQRIEYVACDAHAMDGLPDAYFNGVTCNLGVMNFADLRAVFDEVHRVLQPNGWFVFTMTHPCFETPFAEWTRLSDGTPARAVNQYFNERFWRMHGEHHVRRVGNFHRTLSTVFTTLLSADFIVSRVYEPRSSLTADAHDNRFQQVPVFLGIAARRGARAPASPGKFPGEAQI